MFQKLINRNSLDGFLYSFKYQDALTNCSYSLPLEQTDRFALNTYHLFKYNQEHSCWVFEKFEHPNKKQKVENVLLYYSRKRDHYFTRGQGSPFIVLAGHFYIPTLPLDIWDIPLTLCTKMSKVVKALGVTLSLFITTLLLFHTLTCQLHQYAIDQVSFRSSPKLLEFDQVSHQVLHLR